MPALTPATDPMHLLAPAGRRPLLQRPGEPARHAPGHSRSAPGRGIARGFTLVELAMVLVILALLGGSLLVPVASRLEARDRNATLERLRDIQHALTGFAIIHGRLPFHPFNFNFNQRIANLDHFAHLAIECGNNA